VTFYGSQFEPGTPGKANLIQGKVGDLIANDQTAFDAVIPQLDLPLSPQGSYKALQNMQAASGTLFNRLALLVVSNGDFAPKCGSTSLADLAKGGLAAGMDTYVMALSGSTVNAGNAAAIGAVGGNGGAARFFDLTDPSKTASGAANALSTIQNDLATCVYNLPNTTCGYNEIDSTYRCTQFGDVTIEANATISYFANYPGGGASAAIVRDPTCNASSSTTANGWSREGDHIRICGAPCETLRTQLKNNAAYHLAQGEDPPALPIFISNCAGDTPLTDGGAPPPLVDSGSDSSTTPDAGPDAAGSDAGVQDASAGG
jgi:hypothetical protein